MKTLLALAVTCLTMTSTLLLGADFTPDHLEGVFRGSSLSENEPDYCSLDIVREVKGQKIIFTSQVSHHGMNLGGVRIDSLTVAEQLKDHPSYVELLANDGHTIININQGSILNFIFIKLNKEGKIEKHLICSQK